MSSLVYFQGIFAVMFQVKTVCLRWYLCVEKVGVIVLLKQTFTLEKIT